MPLPRFASTLQLAIRLIFCGSLAISCWGQDVPSAPTPQTSAAAETERVGALNYAKPVSHFPNPIGPYRPRRLPPPDLSNTGRIEQFLHDGKLYLALDDAIALALENNLDIAIARYTMNIADTDILRARAGATILGTPVGLVLNTPGGGVGGIGAQSGAATGGTSLGAGGLGAGTNGLVSSTLGFGPPIGSFDPVLTGTLQEDHFSQQTSSSFSVPLLIQNTGTVDFAYNQAFQWGTNLSVGFNNTRATTNNIFTSLSPQLNSNFRATVTQHLLQGLGFAPNQRFIRIARNNRELSDVAFRLQVTDSVDQTENIYWDLVFAYENVRVQNESLAFAQKTLSDTKKQVEIGSLAPIEVVRAQSTVATDQQAVTTAMTNLQLQQLLMKNALSRTLVDPRLADAEVITTSTMQLPAQEPVTPTEELVNDALGHRAELAEARINLTNTEISKKAIRSLLLPSLDLFAYYGGSGIGGDVSPFCNFGGAPCFNSANAAPPFRNGGPVSYVNALDQMVTSAATATGVGLTLSIPIRNRVAQATQVRSELEYRQAQMRLQQTENQIRIEVRNAQFSVTHNRAAVEAAQAAAELGRQSLDAEQKKYALGASTSTLVLQNQSALATAESNLVSAMAAYEKAQVERDRATGLLLDHSGIVVADAERGEVTHAPKIPYVAPRADVQQTTTPPQQ